MDGWLDEDYDIMERSSMAFQPVSLYRDRLSRPDTFCGASFTRKQLDDLAPLSGFDMLSLRLNNPSPNTKHRLQLRIRAARNLKYKTAQRDESC